MLRSTKKEAKEKIRAYILYNMDFSGYIGYEGYPDKEPETWQDRVLLCRDIFRTEYVNPQNLRRYGGEWGCFREWLCSLPSALTVDFSHYDARQFVREWLEQTEEESAQYDDRQVWEKYLYLITREFFAMVDKAEREKAKKGEQTMNFKDLEGRTVKISAHTITAKDERGKTCGMVRNVRNFLDVPPRVKFDFYKIIRDSGLWGNVDMSRVFMDDGRLVWLYPAHKDEFYHKYIEGNESLFSSDMEHYKKRREIEEKAKSAGVLVVHCFY